MAHRNKGSIIPAILVTGLAIAYWEYVQYILWLILIVLLARVLVKTVRLVRRVANNIRLKDIDRMDGLSFERYVADALTSRGFTNVSLTETFDYGVDIVADKDGVRWGIQTKRYSGLVKADAVRQVVTGLPLYQCDRAMVITNSTFSNVAKRLADSNNCILIGRSELDGLLS